MNDIGMELRKKRKKARFTQDEIAHLLGWSPSKVSKIENNQQEITYREYLEYIEALTAERVATIYITDGEKPQSLQFA